MIHRTVLVILILFVRDISSLSRVGGCTSGCTVVCPVGDTQCALHCQNNGNHCTGSIILDCRQASAPLCQISCRDLGTCDGSFQILAGSARAAIFIEEVGAITSSTQGTCSGTQGCLVQYNKNVEETRTLQWTCEATKPSGATDACVMNCANTCNNFRMTCVASSGFGCQCSNGAQCTNQQTTVAPSLNPTTSTPTTSSPSSVPSHSPSRVPTRNPTRIPSNVPSYSPSSIPTNSPSQIPSDTPSSVPSSSPSSSPSVSPTSTAPSITPTKSPSYNPSFAPTNAPSTSPSTNPTTAPSNSPTTSPTTTKSPSLSPTLSPLENNRTIATSYVFVILQIIDVANINSVPLPTVTAVVQQVYKDHMNRSDIVASDKRAVYHNSTHLTVDIWVSTIPYDPLSLPLILEETKGPRFIAEVQTRLRAFLRRSTIVTQIITVTTFHRKSESAASIPFWQTPIGLIIIISLASAVVIGCLLAALCFVCCRGIESRSRASSNALDNEIAAHQSTKATKDGLSGYETDNQVVITSTPPQNLEAQSQIELRRVRTHEEFESSESETEGKSTPATGTSRALSGVDGEMDDYVTTARNSVNVLVGEGTMGTETKRE